MHTQLNCGANAAVRICSLLSNSNDLSFAKVCYLERLSGVNISSHCQRDMEEKKLLESVGMASYQDPNIIVQMAEQ